MKEKLQQLFKDRKKVAVLAAAVIIAVAAIAGFAIWGGNDGDSKAASANGVKEEQKEGTEGEGTNTRTETAVAMDKIGEAKNYKATSKVTMKMKVNEQSMDSEANMEMWIFPQGDVQKTVTSVNVAGIEINDMVTYIEKDKDGFMTYSSMDNETWQKMKTEEDQTAGASEIFDVFNQENNFEMTGTEEVDGKKAKHYKGTLVGKEMMDMIDSSGATEGTDLESLGIDQEKMLDAIGGMDIELWVDEETGYPCKLKMDMTEYFKTMYSMLETEGVTTEISSVIVEMTWSDINKLDPVKIPDDVRKNAQEVTEEESESKR